MSEDMRKRLYRAAYDAVAHECIHVGPAQVVGLIDDRDRCSDCLRQAVASVQAMLTVLANEHFPDEDVDYFWACEGLAQDVNDVLGAIRGES